MIKFISKKIFNVILIIASFSVIVNANASIILEKAHVNVHNKASVARGAKFFATYCMVCHSLKYLTADPIAKAAGIDYSKMPIQAQTWWAERPPPDLSLIAQARGPDWLYTYLHSFYQDPSVASNNNNLLIDNTNMPNPFAGMQGVQVLVMNKANLSKQNLHYFAALELIKPGTMSPEQFDQTITDVVNFLVYASEPKVYQRHRLGWWALGFLFIFLILVVLLKKAYWKKIKKY